MIDRDFEAMDLKEEDLELVAVLASISTWERILELLFPARRRARERKLQEGIAFLVRNPQVRVEFRD